MDRNYGLVAGTIGGETLSGKDGSNLWYQLRGRKAICRTVSRKESSSR